MTTHEAFKKVISKRAWYKEIGMAESAGRSLAKRFNDGESISTDKIEEVLKKAGYTVAVEKLWINVNAEKQ